jgi:NNP family nitrate/nitrite transporter-like MFS transporter
MSHTIANWDPEDTVAWEAGNKNIARRNLIWSVPAEHIGFSIWSIWSVMVLFMPEADYGFTAGDKFLLGATATLVGGLPADPLHAGHRDVRRSQLDGVLTAATVKV